MAKYRGAYREDLGEEEKKYSEEFSAQGQEPAHASETDEESFKKRYGDLRRYMQSQMATKDRELAQMKQQLDSATKQQIRFPKTEKEVADWVRKYPDVAKIIDTIAQKRSLEALQMGEEKMKSLKEFEQRLTRREAEAELRRLHPDFDKVRANPKFHEWAKVQPKWVQDALYSNTNDAMSCARAIDLYKADMRKKGQSTGAAQAVDSGNSATSAPRSGRGKFTESQVAKMKPHEYEANEAAILDAIKRGEFVYDLTGGAR